MSSSSAVAEAPDRATEINLHSDRHRPTIELDHPKPLSEKISVFAIIVLPLLGVIAAMVLLWGTSFHPVHLVLLVAGYLLTGHGITIGYHRLFTHRAFKAGPIVTATLGILAGMAMQGNILEWVSDHRRHHRYSDGELDPHSPHAHGPGIRGILRGFAHSHMGWLLDAKPKDAAMYVRDLSASPLIRALDSLYWVWVLLGLVIPGAIALAVTGTWIGALQGVLWGGLVRIWMVHHFTWSVNSACHLWGARPYRSHDESRNNVIMGFLALGEGWHNNHHAFPTSARHGLRWWQFDSTYLVIRAMEALGLVRDVRSPDRDRIAGKTRASA
jgi:stearoyl-CoA desaturase (delta-9 desaturase)